MPCEPRFSPRARPPLLQEVLKPESSARSTGRRRRLRGAVVSRGFEPCWSGRTPGAELRRNASSGWADADAAPSPYLRVVIAASERKNSRSALFAIRANRNEGARLLPGGALGRSQLRRRPLSTSPCAAAILPWTNSCAVRQRTLDLTHQTSSSLAWRQPPRAAKLLVSPAVRRTSSCARRHFWSASAAQSPWRSIQLFYSERATR